MADDDPLAHGPNPAHSAQPGVDAPSEFSQPEYDPDGFNPFNADPVEPAPGPAKAPAKAKAAALDEDGEDDEEAAAGPAKAKATAPPVQHHSAAGKAGGRA